MIASQWALSWRCYATSLMLFIIFNLDRVSTVPLPSSCVGVTCPTEDCKPSSRPYIHECCGTQKICSCYHNSSRTFHPQNSEWLTTDCRQRCKCQHVLDSSFVLVLATKCQPFRCPMLVGSCKSGYEKCCQSCTKKPTDKCYSKELGKHFEEGQTWKISPCQHCVCNSGRTRCGHQECHPFSCPAGSTPKALPNQCCPSYCRNNSDSVKPNQPCRDENGTRPHGTKRHPKWPCSPYECVCRHGEWECDPTSSACPTRCVENRTMQFGGPGRCCRLCAGKKSCIDDRNRFREAGEMWTNDATGRQCGCVHGVVHCMLISNYRILHSTDAPTFGGVERNDSILTIIILGLIVFVVILITLCFVFIKRYHPWHLPFNHLHLTPKRSHRAARSHNNSEVTPTSLHFSKKGADEVLLVSNNNSTLKNEPLIS